jgi:hypothetical protein
MLDKLGVTMCTGVKWLRVGLWVKNIPGRILFRGRATRDSPCEILRKTWNALVLNKSSYLRNA